MKKTIYIMLLLALSSGLFGQGNVVLTFTAVYEEQHVLIDSILIENLTQTGEVMIFGDTLVDLENVGIREYITLDQNSFTLFQNYPNPVSTSTTIEIYIPDKDRLDIRISNILGSELFSSSYDLEKGMHAFTFIPGKENCYYVTATGNISKQTTKIISSGTNKAACCNLLYEGLKTHTPVHKSLMISRDFPYAPGDELRITGYASTSLDVLGSNVIEDAPQGDESYVFHITEGIACSGLPWIDYEGLTYNTVRIGTQCWLKENLNIGNMIQSSGNMSNNGSIEKYCYGNSTVNCENYGGLYQWDEAMNWVDTPGAQGICPAGWHVPTIAEWTVLTDYLGDNPSEKLKKAGTALWDCSNDQATNESGFTGLAGGQWYDWGQYFIAIGLQGDFWSSDDFQTTNGACRGLVCNGIYMVHGSYEKVTAISVRCIKNN